MIKYTEKMLLHDAECMAVDVTGTELKYNSIYGIPRGGIPFASILSGILGIPMVQEKDITKFTLVVDDVVDSGKTREKFKDYDFAAIHIKNGARPLPTYYCYAEISQWIHYFWEGNSLETSAEDIVTRQLQFIGENLEREGLAETPKRVVKAWETLFSGYKQNPKDIIKVFDAEGYDEIVLLKDIELYSMCEHHMLPFIGRAHVAYIPDKKVIGVSKLARLVDMFSRRLQIQERLGNQVSQTLMDYLQPKGAACIIEAQHLCMQMRGVQKQNSVMTTSSLKGVFLKDIKAREELMRLIK